MVLIPALVPSAFESPVIVPRLFAVLPPLLAWFDNGYVKDKNKNNNCIGYGKSCSQNPVLFGTIVPNGGGWGGPKLFISHCFCGTFDPFWRKCPANSR